MKIAVVGGGPGGLYFALLAAKAWPNARVTVFERNRPDETFGFGVVFSDETLGIFREQDRESYEQIRRSFAYWGDVAIHYRGHVLRCGGNGFCGCSRQRLLTILQARCTELGVTMCHQHEVAGRSELAGFDLIVAADGINSRLREADRSRFGTAIELQRNKFAWLGSTRSLDAFSYFFRETPHGIVLAHAYQYEPDRSTWVIELAEETWRNLGLDTMPEPAYIAALERIFAEELQGHRLIGNRSIWRNFPTVTNRTWVDGNLVLIGDAKATAHYSIGSGTKLAMEDAIALFQALDACPNLTDALAAYERGRREEVEKTQHAANVSLAWFEHMGRYWGMAPEQFAFGVMSRSKQITYENLRLRDATFVERVERWFLGEVRRAGFAVDDGTPPMFTPFRLRDLVLENRVVVSPMDQYMAVDGAPTEWHYVHYGSRAIGGAGLLFTEMTCTAPDARITPGCTGLWNEDQCAAWRRIVEFVHTHSRAKICMQLGHAGRKGSTQLGWEDENHPLPQGNWPIYSASPIPYFPDSQTPIELSRADMDRVIAEFVRATSYAEAAGFDMLEVHMAHGYLLASFISPLTNRRSDGYGGDIARRMRFPLELLRAVRAAWPAHKPLSVRLSGTDWHPEGLSAADLVAAARMLKAAGADLIDCSAGQTVPDQRPVYGRMFQAHLADQVRNEAGIATMAVGNITTADQVNTLLLQGRADLVALARPHLSDPYFTLRAAAQYGYRGQYWPPPYYPGRNQLYRLAEREQAELRELRLRLRPPSHEVKGDS
ncbi:MAG: bifunctional salicylyl-CoA 5-hydroxylase/oxidoreductase [Chloroflexi bacterium OHK40]